MNKIRLKLKINWHWLVRVENLKRSNIRKLPKKRLINEFAGTSAKFQKLFKDSYVRYNQTREVL